MATSASSATSEEAQTSHVDAEQRNRLVRHQGCAPEKRAVAAQDDQKINRARELGLRHHARPGKSGFGILH